jgi:hypothetical protein
MVAIAIGFAIAIDGKLAWLYSIAIPIAIAIAMGTSDTGRRNLVNNGTHRGSE